MRPTFAVALAGAAVLGLRLVPVGNAPQVRDGYVIRGEAPRTLALYDESWKLKTVAQCMKGGAALPVRGVVDLGVGCAWPCRHEAQEQGEDCDRCRQGD